MRRFAFRQDPCESSGPPIASFAASFVEGSQRNREAKAKGKPQVHGKVAKSRRASATSSISEEPDRARMAARVLRRARDDLRDAAKYRRAIPPPRVGRYLAARVVSVFNASLPTVVAMPLSRPEHPEMPGVRYVLFARFPYMAFYVVDGDDIVVIAVEHTASDYASRVLRRVGSAR